MLDVIGSRFGACDGISRRNFLRIGSLGLAGLTLPEILQARASAAQLGSSPKNTAVIQVLLAGGPSQMDTYDLKPDAPREFRGEFKPISTNVSGASVCELMPRHAQAMDKMALVRSLSHESSDHFVGTHWIMTGYQSSPSEQQKNERPSVGSIVAKLRGPNGPGVPPYISMVNGIFGGIFQSGAYLGPGFNPFNLNGDPTTSMRVQNLEPSSGLSLERLEDRRYLLGKLDRLNRQRDISGTMDGLDKFTAQAYDMVTGRSARKALNLATEDPRLRDRYGRNRFGQSCLLARRLVEAGVTFVTISEGNWDHHSGIFQLCRQQIPPFDAAVTTLVEDIYNRGLADRVLVVVWGEFGRTPRINNGGRDHWPGSMSAMLAGGGLKMGQVVGATNRKGEQPTERPLRPEDVIHTVYHVLGINPRHEFPNDSGRPMPVLNQGRPIADLIS
jgi:hypothetical protein